MATSSLYFQNNPRFRLLLANRAFVPDHRLFAYPNGEYLHILGCVRNTDGVVTSAVIIIRPSYIQDDDQIFVAVLDDYQLSDWIENHPILQDQAVITHGQR